MAIHSLQYMEPLMGVMQEIYRICKHKAVVCIVVPYAHTYFHAANPHYKSWFNEFTPLYLTDNLYKSDYLQELPYTSPFSPERGSIEPVGINFQLLKMECFYYQPFASMLYDDDEREMARHIQPNVVDEIMYHFAVVKEPVSGEELEELAIRSLEEPQRITERNSPE